MYFLQTYVQVPVKPRNPGGSPMPPERQNNYRITDFGSVPYCPSNEGNTADLSYGEGPQSNIDYRLRGFGATAVLPGGGPPDKNEVIGYPRYSVLGARRRGKVTLIQDTVWRPSKNNPCSLTDNVRYINHQNNGVVQGGNVSFADGSVRWVKAEGFVPPPNRCNTSAFYIGAWSVRDGRRGDALAVSPPDNPGVTGVALEEAGFLGY
jgi:prepilin-type processing-associated H-X9-DG protein